MLTICTRFGESWEQTAQGVDMYIAKERMSLCVDRDISIEYFMQVLYKKKLDKSC